MLRRMTRSQSKEEWDEEVEEWGITTDEVREVM